MEDMQRLLNMEHRLELLTHLVSCHELAVYGLCFYFAGCAFMMGVLDFNLSCRKTVARQTELTVTRTNMVNFELNRTSIVA